ncbi:hypothetical protein THRCLA_08133 [Thraustotheca clavata]|uniref:EF-hand domain-containing protein n=1 Tax=Thraustotheca clavata TaxID=74557 RepID=A0A1V9Z9L3_9STRA|nr:hypothetical protein THRCLA_08133 [Thraustotheca clavata]
MFGNDAVGWRVEVYWTDEEEWFAGVITEYNEEQGYYVCYDDGDEKWQESNCPTSMRFLANTIDVDTTNDVQNTTQINSDQTDNYSDDDEPVIPSPVKPQVCPVPQADAVAISPKVSDAIVSKLVIPVTKPSMLKPKIKPSNAIFFKDREELREIKNKLEATKQSLITELEQVKVTLKAASTKSTLLKESIAEYTTKLTVANLASTSKLAAQSPEERTLELSMCNKQMTKENSELLGTKSDIKQRVERLQTKSKSLQLHWENVPQKEKCTLIEVQLEIALLLQQKANLEAKVSEIQPSAHPTESVDTKIIKQKLSEADARIWELKRDCHSWKLQVNQEQTKLAALQARKLALAEQLQRFRSSKVLLRSAFDRCDSDCNGVLTMNETIRLLKVLLEGQEDANFEQTIKTYFQRADSNQDKVIDFNEFCTAFEQIATK